MSGIKQEMQWVQQEAGRCLYCVDAPCMKGCPAQVNVPQFIRALRYGDLRSAVKYIKNANPFGSVCGDLCPSEKLCQKNCTLNCSDNPIRIRDLQKYVCDNTEYKPVMAEAKCKKVAVIGAGPAGLACAAMLSRKGYSVDVFEREKEAAGVIAKEIPDYRVTPEIIRKDVDELSCDRITVNYGVSVTKEDITAKYAKEYDAVFVGVGLDKDRNTGVTVAEGAKNV